MPNQENRTTEGLKDISSLSNKLDEAIKNNDTIEIKEVWARIKGVIAELGKHISRPLG